MIVARSLKFLIRKGKTSNLIISAIVIIMPVNSPRKCARSCIVGYWILDTARKEYCTKNAVITENIVTTAILRCKRLCGRIRKLPAFFCSWRFLVSSS